MSSQKVVLITGASSGIGQSIARLLAQKGFTVFGTSRNPHTIEHVPAVEVLPLDVRSDESVKACVDTLLVQAGSSTTCPTRFPRLTLRTFRLTVLRLAIFGPCLPFPNQLQRLALARHHGLDPKVDLVIEIALVRFAGMQM